MRGVVIRQLGVGHQPMGVYRSRSRAVHWDGRNQFGEKVATGLYFYTLKAGDFTATREDVDSQVALLVKTWKEYATN